LNIKSDPIGKCKTIIDHKKSVVPFDGNWKLQLIVITGNCQYKWRRWVKATQEKFPRFNACSFDKGFHSPANQTDLKALIEQVILPKKGKLSKADQEREYAPEFKQAKQQHSAVESGAASI
jgi:hypothetical protein